MTALAEALDGTRECLPIAAALIAIPDTAGGPS